MTIFVMTAVPENIRGKITKWLLEVKPGVFVGRLSKTVRDLVWKDIVEQNVEDALMIYNYNNEQGYKFEMLGSPDRFVIDFDGLELIGIKKISDIV